MPGEKTIQRAIENAIKDISTTGDAKVVIIDQNGNVISDISLSALRDALKGADNKDFSTLEAAVNTLLKDSKIPAAIQQDADGAIHIVLKTDNVGLATEATLSAIKKALASVGTDKILTTPDNPPNLDVELSTRASEATLSSIDGKVTKVDTDNVKVVSEVAYDSTNDRKKISIENDAVGLAKSADISADQPRHITNAYDSTNDRFKVDAQVVANPPNLDIALSALRDALKGADNKDFSTLEADVETLLKALASVGTDKLLTTPDNPPALDVNLTTLARLQRWGRDIEPVWIHGDEITAPAAGTALVTKAVSTGKTGYIYGFFITAGEANDFKINWTSGGAAYSRRIVFASPGSVEAVDIIPLNEGLPADAGSSITITNVNAGGTGVVYQAGILYAEV